MSTNKNDYYHLGLTDDEVLQSREKNGVNLLTPPKRPSLWKLYLEKFEDPVVRVLLVAAVFSLIIYTVVAVLVGIILEFFVFGGDYTRTERLEYEDDDYYYYVKAVPKALVATSERSIKKINGESAREERKSAERVVNYSTPLFQGEEPPKKKKRVQETEAASVVQKADIDDIDFEKKLEESLKDL